MQLTEVTFLFLIKKLLWILNKDLSLSLPLISFYFILFLALYFLNIIIFTCV